MKVTSNIIGLIKHEMVRHKWETPADLARACGMDRSTARSILNGKRKTIDDDTVTKLCVALGLSEADLVSKATNVVKESRSVYSTRDPLIVFIERDMTQHPEHRSAYEGIASAFGYSKGGRT